MSPQKYATVRGVGGYLPPKVLTNDDLATMMDTSHDWIVRRTGICQRHVAAKDQKTWELAWEAAQKALDHAQLGPQALDLIIVATSTPDYGFPATASWVQRQLQAHNAVVFDINAACSGFLFALSVAQQYLENGFFTRAMVIGAETMSRIVNWTDRTTAVLFGDGAGAVVLEASTASTPGEARGILAMDLFSRGEGCQALYVKPGDETSSRGVIVMEGQEVFCQAVRSLEASALKLLGQHNIQIKDMAWFVSHQANKRILSAVGERLGIPPQKLIFTGTHHANTSAASIPLALWESAQQGLFQPGDLLFLQAFGAGFTGGSCLLRW